MHTTKIILLALLFAAGIGVVGLGGDTIGEQVKAKTAAVKQADRVTTANSALDQTVSNVKAAYGPKVGVVVYDPTTNHTASANANEQFVSASLYKLFVAYGVLRGVDTGTLNIDRSLDSVNESVETCLDKMITVSDNDCGKALGDLVGWAQLDSLLHHDGYTGTMLNNYYSDGSLNGDKQTTAADVSLLLERLYNGTLLSSTSNQRFLTLLGSQEINSYLPSGFPDGTKIAHKTGTLYGYVHDAGIVYGDHKNLIVVFMSGQWSDPDPDSIPVFQAFGQSLEQYLAAY